MNVAEGAIKGVWSQRPNYLGNLCRVEVDLERFEDFNYLALRKLAALLLVTRGQCVTELIDDICLLTVACHIRVDFPLLCSHDFWPFHLRSCLFLKWINNRLQTKLFELLVVLVEPIDLDKVFC